MLSTRSTTLLDDEVSAPNPAQVIVFSIDFDGCIFNGDYLDHPENKNRLIEYNEKLINFIVGQINKHTYDRVIFLVGSNRQSYQFDQQNIIPPYKGSCFPEMKALIQEIENRAGVPCLLDPYLLADSYGAKPHGDTFNRSLAGESNNFPNSVWDSYKFSILYAQTHKVSAENRNAEIHFNFFDDRYKDILPTLLNFYSREHSLLPRTLKSLKFFHYDELNLQQFHISPNHVVDIQGTGPIDYYFDSNLILMAKVGNFNGDLKTTPLVLDISQTLEQSEVLQRFKQNRKINIDEICVELAHVINVHLAHNSRLQPLHQAVLRLQEALTNQVSEMQKQMPIDEIDHSNVAKIATDFLNMLNAFFLSHEVKNKDIDQFIALYNPQTIANKVINITRSWQPNIYGYSNNLRFYKTVNTNILNLMSNAKEVALQLEKLKLNTLSEDEELYSSFKFIGRH